VPGEILNLRDDPPGASRRQIRVRAYTAAAAIAFLLWQAYRYTEPSHSTALAAAVPAPVSASASASAADATTGSPLNVGPRAPASAASAATPQRPLIAEEQASIASTIEVIVRRNDTLDAIFRRMALDSADLAAIRNLPGIRQSLDFLKPGDAIKLTHTDGEIRELVRQVSETQTLKVVRADTGFAARLIDVPVETRLRTAQATIDTSLFQAATAADLSDTEALKLADIFAWDIDFVLDIREGDRFTLVYEQIYKDGRYRRDGEILAAEFVNDGRVYRALRYVADSGRAGYYTPEGLPLRKAFLRAPVEFTRVSSGFNPHRLHPILNRIRGHMGTDYAAPTGTPVHAAAAGRVSFAGRRGGYGNAIILAHNNNVSTLYGHLSRFAKRLHWGTRVEQGQVIGYVGMTGLATGPHLHYEYLSNGVHRNPQTLRLPGGDPLPAESLRKFLNQTAPLLAALNAPQRPAAAVSASAIAASPSAGHNAPVATPAATASTAAPKPSGN
jgi:murein DD-endopeptidase MepM/ murein hydrolase activator NlpD